MVEILKKFSLEPLDIPMILISALLFVALWKILDKKLFSPYLALLDARDSLTTGAADSARELLQKAETLTNEYNGRIVQTRVEAMKLKLEAVNAAKAEAQSITEQAEGEAQELIRNARWETAQKITALREEAFREADRMADAIVQKLAAPAKSGERSIN
jgi:F0F1-type ATP synthase membrane subunit b/b'